MKNRLGEMKKDNIGLIMRELKKMYLKRMNEQVGKNKHDFNITIEIFALPNRRTQMSWREPYMLFKSILLTKTSHAFEIDLKLVNCS